MEIRDLPTVWIKDRLALLHRQRANVVKFGPEYELAAIDRHIRTLQAELDQRYDEAESTPPGP